MNTDQLAFAPFHRIRPIVANIMSSPVTSLYWPQLFNVVVQQVRMMNVVMILLRRHPLSLPTLGQIFMDYPRLCISSLYAVASMRNSRSLLCDLNRHITDPEIKRLIHYMTNPQITDYHDIVYNPNVGLIVWYWCRIASTYRETTDALAKASKAYNVVCYLRDDRDIRFGLLIAMSRLQDPARVNIADSPVASKHLQEWLHYNTTIDARINIWKYCLGMLNNEPRIPVSCKALLFDRGMVQILLYAHYTLNISFGQAEIGLRKHKIDLPLDELPSPIRSIITNPHITYFVDDYVGSRMVITSPWQVDQLRSLGIATQPVRGIGIANVVLISLLMTEHYILDGRRNLQLALTVNRFRQIVCRLPHSCRALILYGGPKTAPYIAHLNAFIIDHNIFLDLTITNLITYLARFK